MYRLSFIIPVYNVENYVLPCLESAARAGGGRCEIVIVDDGSTDKSGEICDAFAKEHPEAVVIHQKNAGLGGARNTGIDAARGEYLFFLDSDDTVTDDAADTVLSVLDKTDADILEFRIRGHREDGSELYTTSQPLEAGRIYDVKNDMFILTVTPSACDKVFRASLFRDTGVRFPDHVWYEDLWTVPKLTASSKRYVYTDSVIYNYLCRTGSIMNNSKTERCGEIMGAMESTRMWFRENGLEEQYSQELEYMTATHVLADACTRVIKQAGWRHPLLKKLRAYTLEHCGKGFMKTNAYCRTLGGSRRIVMQLLYRGHFFLLWLIFKIK